MVSVCVMESFLISTTNILQNRCSAHSVFRGRSRKCPRESGWAGSTCYTRASTGFTTHDYIEYGSVRVLLSAVLRFYISKISLSVQSSTCRLYGIPAACSKGDAYYVLPFSFTFLWKYMCSGWLRVWQLPVHALGRTRSVAEQNRFIDVYRPWLPRGVIGKNPFLAKMSITRHPSLISGSHHHTCQTSKFFPAYKFPKLLLFKQPFNQISLTSLLMH